MTLREPHYSLGITVITTKNASDAVDQRSAEVDEACLLEPVGGGSLISTGLPFVRPLVAMVSVGSDIEFIGSLIVTGYPADDLSPKLVTVFSVFVIVILRFENICS
jgi:hypothetical protein